MAATNENKLSKQQLESLEDIFQRGADNASKALANWLGRPSVISVESVEQLALDEATGVLGTGDDPICFCSADMVGAMSGQLILAFDDASGLALADMLLDQPLGRPSHGATWRHPRHLKRRISLVARISIRYLS